MRAWRAGLCVLFVAVSVAAGAAAQTQPKPGEPAQLLGTWRGTSLCTDRVAAPACHDESVVYDFTLGPKPGTLQWAADKVVDGERQHMGDLELSYDKTEGCWKAEFSSPRGRTVWRLTVDGTRLSGTGRLQPGNQTVRKMELRKDH